MRQVVADLANISTPDAQLAEAAKALSTIPGASSIWSWLDLHAAPKGSYSPNHLMAALKRLNKRPLRSNNERQAACTIVQALGKSADWSTEEHADWLAPLIHSMSSDPNAFNNKLATAMVIGLSHRDGLFHHLGQVTNHFIYSNAARAHFASGCHT